MEIEKENKDPNNDSNNELKRKDDGSFEEYKNVKKRAGNFRMAKLITYVRVYEMESFNMKPKITYSNDYDERSYYNLSMVTNEGYSPDCGVIGEDEAKKIAKDLGMSHLQFEEDSDGNCLEDEYVYIVEKDKIKDVYEGNDLDDLNENKYFAAKIEQCFVTPKNKPIHSKKCKCDKCIKSNDLENDDLESE